MLSSRSAQNSYTVRYLDFYIQGNLILVGVVKLSQPLRCTLYCSKIGRRAQEGGGALHRVTFSFEVR